MSLRSSDDPRIQALAGRICGQSKYANLFTARDYHEAFQRYLDETAPLLQELCAVCAQGEEEASAAARALLTAVSQRWQSGKRRRPEDYVDSLDKLVLITYFFPAMQKTAQPGTEAFLQAFSAAWAERYPNSPYQLASYEEVDAGFRRKLCFITTAVCRYEGQADDCYELQQLRAFRDGYLRSCPDGQALIDEYYNIAPAIVAHIDYCCDPARCYPAIQQQYLLPCLADIEAGRLEQCKQRYIAMMRRLQQEHLPC